MTVLLPKSAIPAGKSGVPVLKNSLPADKNAAPARKNDILASESVAPARRNAVPAAKSGRLSPGNVGNRRNTPKNAAIALPPWEIPIPNVWGDGRAQRRLGRAPQTVPGIQMAAFSRKPLHKQNEGGLVVCGDFLLRWHYAERKIDFSRCQSLSLRGELNLEIQCENQNCFGRRTN